MASLPDPKRTELASTLRGKKTAGKDTWTWRNEAANLEAFYAAQTAQGLAPHFYDVILYGPAVNNTVQNLTQHMYGGTYGVHRGVTLTNYVANTDDGEFNNYMVNPFTDWVKNHVYLDTETGGSYVSMRWACSKVKVPMPELEIDTEHTVDVIKTLSPPLVKGYERQNSLTMTVADSRSMVWYHFFNGLVNQFFNFPNLKPRNSLKKMAVAVVPKGIFHVNGGYAQDESSHVQRPSERILATQVMEYNSCVPQSISPLEFMSKAEGKLEFNVTFRVPHPFNESLKPDFDNMVIYTNPIGSFGIPS